MGEPDPASTAGGDAEQTPQALDRMLRGSLPCVGCGYELSGLSVRGRCPECGMAVRATILYVVDPHADAFRPMRRPRLTAIAVTVWPLAALIAVLTSWSPRLADLHDQLFVTASPVPADVGWIPAAAFLLSGIAACALIRPLPESTRRTAISAAIGCFLYVPLIAVAWWLHTTFDPVRPPPYSIQALADGERLMLRFALNACAIAILLCLRPSARLLVARSLVLRTGRVDRQTMIATVAAIGLTVVGDAMRLLSLGLPRAQADFIDLFAMMLVIIGSLLVTLAVAGAVIDSWRIRRAILTPSPSLRQLLHER